MDLGEDLDRPPDALLYKTHSCPVHQRTCSAGEHLVLDLPFSSADPVLDDDTVTGQHANPFTVNRIVKLLVDPLFVL